MHDTWMRCLTGLNGVFGDGWVGGWMVFGFRWMIEVFGLDLNV